MNAAMAANAPKAKVSSAASEKARCMAATICGIRGSSCARASAGAPARMAWPRSPTAVKRLSAAVPDDVKPAAICGGTPDVASCRGISTKRRDVKIDPVIARPTLPPICWKRVRLLVAVPIWRGATEACTINVSTANIGPTPRPVMNIHTYRSGNGVSARSPDRRNKPSASIAAAPSTTNL